MKQFSLEFATRHYELDSFGHVNNANYLRWCEHARVEWFRSAAYDIEALKRANLLLVVTVIDSTFRLPLSHSAQVRMTVAAGETRRTSGKLVQILYDVATGREAFRCFVDWAVVGDRHTPAAKDALEGFRSMVAANYAPDAPIQKSRPDAVWTMPGRTHTTRLSSQAHELDSFGHVNNAVYAQYLEAGRWGFLGKIGLLKPQKRTDQTRHFAMILARQRIEYVQAVGLMEPLAIVSGVHDVGHARYVMRQEIRHAKTQKLYTRGSAEICGLDSSTGRPTAFPLKLADKLRFWAEASA